MRTWAHRKRERLDGINDLLLYARGASVFDVGCNRGLVGYELAACGAVKVHGCDLSVRSIDTARHIFEDVIDVESKFEVVDLSSGASAIAGFGLKYDIVLLLGVYHKLARVMSSDALAGLINELGRKTLVWFAWNGFRHEFETIDKIMWRQGLKCVSRTDEVSLQTAIWKRQ